MKISVVLVPSKDKGFSVVVPSLKGCISQGDTKKEALKNIRKAIKLYLKLDEDEIPKHKKGVIIEKVKI